MTNTKNSNSLLHHNKVKIPKKINNKIKMSHVNAHQKALFLQE